MPRFPKLSLEGAVAVVTGAGGGIGSAISHSLARRGCHLALTDFKPDALAESAAAARACGVKVTEHVFDIADPKAVAAFPAAIEAEHGRLTVLVNNAGVLLFGKFEECSLEEFDWLFNINFHAAVRMMKAFIPMLLKEPEAQIVNISSLFGLVGCPGEAAYSASKFALRGLSESIRQEFEFSGKHLGVTVVHPGGVRTNIARNAKVAAGMPSGKFNLKAEEKEMRVPPALIAEKVVKGLINRSPRVLCGSFAVPADIVQRITPTGYPYVFRLALGGGKPPKKTQ